MRYLPRNITTLLLLFLTNVIAASFPPPRSIRAASLLQNEATAVSPVLDEARAVRQVISAEGGQLTTTAADGTRFTLVVPPTALLSSVEVTMTPVAQVGQLPLSGGLVAAVQLEPEGLLLWQPASLTIEPAVPFPVAQQLSFTWREEGEGFHLYPLQIDPSTITMSLVHFSGYGVGSGTDADGAGPSPPGEQDQLESNTEKQTRDERKFRYQNPDLKKKALKKRNRQLCATFNQELLRFFDLLTPQLDPALASKDQGKLRCLLNAALKWETFARIEQAFTGCLPESLSAASDILANFRLKALETLADKAYERCGNEPGEAIRLWSLEKQTRQYAAGYADGVTEVLFLQLAGRIAEKAKKCARFELQFESIAIDNNVRLDGSGSSEGHVRATVPIEYEPGKTPLAESPLEYLSFSFNVVCDDNNNVVKIVGYQGSTFQVQDLKFDLNLRDDNDCSGPNKAEAVLVSMTISPGYPIETIINCDDDEPRKVSYWAGSWYAVHGHLGEVEPSGNRVVIRGWARGENQLLARKTYQESFSFFSDTTVINLFYRPE